MQNHIVKTENMIEDADIYLLMKMDQLRMQKLNKVMATLKHPKQSQHKIAAPSSELENKNNGGSDMKNTSEN